MTKKREEEKKKAPFLTGNCPGLSLFLQLGLISHEHGCVQ